MFSPLVKGQGTWDGRLELREDGFKKPSFDALFPSIPKLQYDETTRLYNKDPEPESLELPKTFLTRKGAIVLFSSPKEQHENQQQNPKKSLEICSCSDVFKKHTQKTEKLCPTCQVQNEPEQRKKIFVNLLEELVRKPRKEKSVQNKQEENFPADHNRDSAATHDKNGDVHNILSRPKTMCSLHRYTSAKKHKLRPKTVATTQLPPEVEQSKAHPRITSAKPRPPTRVLGKLPYQNLISEFEEDVNIHSDTLEIHYPSSPINHETEQIHSTCATNEQDFSDKVTIPETISVVEHDISRATSASRYSSWWTMDDVFYHGSDEPKGASLADDSEYPEIMTSFKDRESLDIFDMLSRPVSSLCGSSWDICSETDISEIATERPQTGYSEYQDGHSSIRSSGIFTAGRHTRPMTAFSGGRRSSKGPSVMSYNEHAPEIDQSSVNKRPVSQLTQDSGFNCSEVEKAASHHSSDTPCTKKAENSDHFSSENQAIRSQTWASSRSLSPKSDSQKTRVKSAPCSTGVSHTQKFWSVRSRSAGYRKPRSAIEDSQIRDTSPNAQVVRIPSATSCNVDIDQSDLDESEIGDVDSRPGSGARTEQRDSFQRPESVCESEIDKKCSSRPDTVCDIDRPFSRAESTGSRYSGLNEDLTLRPESTTCLESNQMSLESEKPVESTDVYSRPGSVRSDGQIALPGSQSGDIPEYDENMDNLLTSEADTEKINDLGQPAESKEESDLDSLDDFPHSDFNHKGDSRPGSGLTGSIVDDNARSPSRLFELKPGQYADNGLATTDIDNTDNTKLLDGHGENIMSISAENIPNESKKSLQTPTPQTPVDENLDDRSEKYATKSRRKSTKPDKKTNLTKPDKTPRKGSKDASSISTKNVDSINLSSSKSNDDIVSTSRKLDEKPKKSESVANVAKRKESMAKTEKPKLDGDKLDVYGVGTVDEMNEDEINGKLKATSSSKIDLSDLVTKSSSSKIKKPSPKSSKTLNLSNKKSQPVKIKDEMGGKLDVIPKVDGNLLKALESGEGNVELSEETLNQFAPIEHFEDPDISLLDEGKNADSYSPSQVKQSSKKGKGRKKKDTTVDKALEAKERRRKMLEEKEKRQEELRLLKEREDEQKRLMEEVQERQRAIEEETIKRMQQEADATKQEEDAVALLKEARRKAKEEREKRREEEAERRRHDVQRRREEKRERELEIQERELELGKQHVGRERRKAELDARKERERELERMAEEQRKEEERLRLLELEDERKLEEEDIREAEDALQRLAREREYREQMRKIAEAQQAKLEKQESERRLKEQQERAAIEAERKRLEDERVARENEERDRIRQLRHQEALARMKAAQEAAKRRAWALHRRERNLERMAHLKSTRQSQKITTPYGYSYYPNIPRKVMELPYNWDSKKKRGFKPANKKKKPNDTQ